MAYHTRRGMGDPLLLRVVRLSVPFVAALVLSAVLIFLLLSADVGETPALIAGWIAFFVLGAVLARRQRR